jgi:Tfp pilus assembly protein PilF
LSRRPLPPLRLALVDTDLTRAGALGDELRARGAVLQLVAPEVDATRWHLLRRLSPHALILDERALGTHATWLERVRRDPYLGHVPLLPAPLDRLFLENSGRVDLSPLIPLLLSLGAEELALRDQLRPGRSVEIRLDQLGPSRLLEVLSAHPRPCTAVCSAGSTRLEWSFATGQALGAQLETPGRGVESVSPEGALEWLLAHPDCRVCVSEGASLPGSAESNTSTEVLLTDSTTGEALPSSPPPPMPSAASGASASSSRRSARAPAAPLPSGHGHGVTQRLRTQAEAVPPLLRARAAALKSRWGALPSRTRSGALVGAGLIATVLVGLAVSGGSAEADTTAQVTAARPPDPDPGMKDGSEPARPPTDDAQALTSTEGAPPFQVAPDAQLPPCPPPEASPQNVATGSTALQKARQRLVAGDVEGARALMCQAAQLEPSGSAAESLALLFLSGRSLDNAKHWAEAALRQDPERRTARELLGDIENQRGNIEASREIWLSTMQLRGDEIARIDAVSRQQVREGLVAVKSRDLPRAERYFRRAITLQPKNGAAAAALAQVLVQLGYREAALAWARHAVSLDPGTRVSLAADFAELAPG